jgi:predicted signal transduction protein with EAL and GGDEF domain
VAGRLQSAVRKGDTVARLGGDEFAVVVQAHDAMSTAIVVAERIIAGLEDVVEIDGTSVRVACSIGIASGAPDASTPDELVHNADVAMYMAKSRGKSCFGVFDDTMHNAMLSRVELRRDLALAVERDELELHYQPIVDLHSEEILGFEALVRWSHPTRGLLPPVEFIGLAEETGDIVPIGGWVLERACRDLAAWQANRTTGRELWVSVNVSASQLLNGDLVETARAALTRHGVNPRALTLELTEEALVADTTQAGAVLSVLRSEGVRVAIDDFGTGFSSLRYLHELPADFIKIDRSFVADSDYSAHRDVVLESIVTMASELGLGLIAEGIERTSERDRLRGLAPMAGQGYLFARPVPAAQVPTLLREGAQTPVTVAVDRGLCLITPTAPRAGRPVSRLAVDPTAGDSRATRPSVTVAVGRCINERVGAG